MGEQYSATNACNEKCIDVHTVRLLILGRPHSLNSLRCLNTQNGKCQWMRWSVCMTHRMKRKQKWRSQLPSHWLCYCCFFFLSLQLDEGFAHLPMRIRLRCANSKLKSCMIWVLGGENEKKMNDTFRMFGDCILFFTLLF